MKLRNANFGDPEAGQSVLFWAEGMPVAAKTQDVNPPSIDYDGTAVQVGNYPTINNGPGESILNHFRLDARAWSDSEIEWHRKQWSDESWRSVSNIAQGRLYRIAGAALQTMGPTGDWDRYAGTITLEELQADPDMVVFDG